MIRIPYLREAVSVALLLAAGWLGWEWRDRSADAEKATTVAKHATALADAQAKAREAEQALTDGLAQADDEADQRDEQIERDYQRRIAAVVSDRDRLQKLWRAERATDRLADDSEAARAADEQDRLRRESAARIVRATERAQAERDEVIDRYEAVRKGINSGRHD